MICRSCKKDIERPFLSLGNQPLSNGYLSSEQLQVMEPTYPLDLFHCTSCHLVQLPECEKASNIFNENYAYFSSFSTSWLEHCSRYADNMTERLGLSSDSFVIEVASNDGYLLQYFKKKSIPVLGIEPAAATARVAIEEKGIPTDVCFFDVPYAKALAASGRKADLLAGNNVLAHNPNLRDFVEAMSIAIKPEGVITLEFPHVLQMMQYNQFDTIYHEHYSYLGLLPLIPLFREFGLTLFDVDELPTHGGSLRIYAAPLKSIHAQKISEKVAAVLAKEKNFGLDKFDTYLKYRSQVEKVKCDLLRFLIDAKEQGKKIVGYGAAAKGNTLLNFCGVRTDFLDYTVDRNPAKQGTFLPGTHIPVYSPAKISETKPDYLLILPWNIKDEIIAQMEPVRTWGGKFVVPIPTVMVL